MAARRIGRSRRRRKYLLQRTSLGFREPPARKRFSDRIEESNGTLPVGGDDAVPNRLDGGAKRLLDAPQAALVGVLGEGQVDTALEVLLAEWLEHVAEGPGRLRAFNRRVIRMAGDEHDWNAEAGENLVGGLDAVELSAQRDVHKRQVRLESLGLPQRLLAGGGRGRDFVAGFLQELANELGDFRFV